MTTFLQVIILVAIASIAILVIYLIDRVNTLQRYTRLLQHDAAEPDDPNAGPFGGLSGERLWDAVSGVPIDGWDKNSIDLVRNRYQLVLRKHVEELFMEGFQNAQAGVQSIPSSSKLIQTLRGAVESWIPIEHAIAIHQAGFDRAKSAEDGFPAVRKALDDAVALLFGLGWHQAAATALGASHSADRDRAGGGGGCPFAGTVRRTGGCGGGASRPKERRKQTHKQKTIIKIRIEIEL